MKPHQREGVAQPAEHPEYPAHLTTLVTQGAWSQAAMNSQIVSPFVQSPRSRQPTTVGLDKYRQAKPAAVAVGDSLLTDAPALRPEIGSVSRQRVGRVAVLRAGLLIGCLACALVGWAGASGASHPVEPELAVLLRGMAAIKGLLAVFAASLIYWRFGLPISARAAWAYATCAGLMFVACALIWQLAVIPLAAALFHAGGIGALCVAWREDRQLPRAAVQAPSPAHQTRSAAKVAMADATTRSSSDGWSANTDSAPR